MCLACFILRWDQTLRTSPTLCSGYRKETRAKLVAKWVECFTEIVGFAWLLRLSNELTNVNVNLSPLEVASYMYHNMNFFSLCVLKYGFKIVSTVFCVIVLHGRNRKPGSRAYLPSAVQCAKELGDHEHNEFLEAGDMQELDISTSGCCANWLIYCLNNRTSTCKYYWNDCGWHACVQQFIVKVD